MTSTHYGTLSGFRFADEATDLRGTLLYGRNDEKLGKIDDVIFDHDTGRIRYAVIDTGGWLRHRRFIVPADRIRAYEKHEDHFFADLTTQQVEAFPPYDHAAIASHEQWSDYEKRYLGLYPDGVVLHRPDSERIITPAPDEMPAAPSAGATVSTGLASAVEGHTPDVWPERIVSPTSPPRGPGVMDKPQEATATSSAVAPLQHRWGAFERSVQDNLSHLKNECVNCGEVEQRKAS